MAATKNKNATPTKRITPHASTPRSESITRPLGFSRYAAKGFGTLYLVHNEGGLAFIEFDLEPAVRLVGRRQEIECPAPLKAALDRYFRGEDEGFEDVALDISGTDFQRRVWEELRRIPYGEVISYGELAERVGAPTATRAVGNANSKNPVPILIPCHRVVAVGMRIGGYTGGVRRKVDLLRLEGLQVDGDRVRRKSPGLFDQR